MQRTLAWHGKPVATYEDLPQEDRDRIKKSIDAVYGMFVQPVIEAMIDDRRIHRVTVGLAVKEIPKIIDLLFEYEKNPPKPSPDNPRSRIALQLLEKQQEAKKLNSKVKTSYAETVSVPNLREFNRFLDTNPAFVDYLTKAGIRIFFRSKSANNIGGLYTHADRIVHLEPGVEGERPGIFLRLLLHELGHASFQRMLMTTKPDALNQDEQAFRDAWTVLRRNNGQYLLGLDLGRGRQPDERRKYQAGDFMEFCAENFMHRVTAPGLLNKHLMTINKPGNHVPQDVRDAWRDAIVILDKYVRLLLR
ncbi:hypothetical protein [Amycolatopsis sp. 505]|uniref:hypothetical protein n=1 Tax=Amycolatopsis sp. 505 TaxID=2761538 RepID=UPI002876DFBD|nr:hypothetical protein [Amycolatopsis sp. 505]MDS0138888.1 hypothetical protein [Amycolatopsis sp. 505]